MMWLACYNQQEIADEIGNSKQAINEFVNYLQKVINATDGESDQSSEKEALTKLQQKIDNDFYAFIAK